jgi:hypothetical protein
MARNRLAPPVSLVFLQLFENGRTDIITFKPRRPGVIERDYDVCKEPQLALRDVGGFPITIHTNRLASFFLHIALQEELLAHFVRPF